MKIVVVGGGTAGWITALYAKKVFPNSSITLIESEKIGILGAGEGSVPEIVSLFDFLEIPFSDLVINCSSTIKNGIKFSNWQKNKSFFHPFDSKCKASNDSNFSYDSKVESNTSFSHFYAAEKNQTFNDYVFMQKLSNSNKVPFIKNNKNSLENKILNFDQIGGWSFHFDAVVLANYLKNIGVLRGIKRVEGLVEKINANQDGHIETILVNSKEICVDFIFDCTGFQRLIIGKFYKSKWKSYSHILPAKKAIPFFLPQEKEIPPYTESTAMNFGWEWKIPLQHRNGCGYVFDSDFLSDEEAKKEIEKRHNIDLEIKKIFSFSPGCYEEVWIKNCLAVGLSSNFLEPLEATSIWQSYRLLNRFFTVSNNIFSKDEKTKKHFNNYYIKETEEIVDFLYLHYVTKKKETNFWKDFTKNNTMPDFVSYILEVSKNRPISESLDFYNRLKIFNFYSYYYILIGNNIISKNQLKKQFEKTNKNKIEEYTSIVSNQQFFVENSENHTNFLTILKN